MFIITTKTLSKPKKLCIKMSTVMFHKLIFLVWKSFFRISTNSYLQTRRARESAWFWSEVAWFLLLFSRMKHKYKIGNKNVKWKFKEIIKLNKVPRCGNRSLTQDETRARCVRFLNSRFGFYFMSLYRALNTFLIEMHSTTKKSK